MKGGSGVREWSEGREWSEEREWNEGRVTGRCRMRDDRG